MKIIVASDIHGSLYWTNKLLEKIEKENPDKVILLGDLYYHGPRNPFPDEYNPKEVCEKLNAIKNKLMVLKGNCDAEVDEMISEFKFYPSLSMNIDSKSVFFSHGHNYNMDKLPVGFFDVIFYGHFHTHFLTKIENQIFANPGSISLPKNNTNNSYAILTDKGISICDFDDNIIDNIEF